jgi:hypothetical protein
MGKECLVVGVQPAITSTTGTSQFEPLDKQAGKFENRPLGPTNFPLTHSIDGAIVFITVVPSKASRTIPSDYDSCILG